MKNLLLTILIMAAAGLVTAQNCDDYSCVIAKVKSALKSKNYETALDNLESADGYADKNSLEIRNLRRSIFEAIELEKDEAKKQRDRAEKSLARVDSLRKVADAEKVKVQVALTRLEKVLKDLENANINQVRLLLVDAERSQKELKFEAAVEKLKIAQLLRALPDSVDLAFYKLSKSLMDNSQRSIALKDYSGAIADLQLVEKLNIMPEKTKEVYDSVKLILEKQISEDILKMDYSSALKNIELAGLINGSEHIVAQNSIELIFCYLEIGQLDQAQGLIEKLAQIKKSKTILSKLLDINQLPTQSRLQSLRDLCFQIDSSAMQRCEDKYFPRLHYIKVDSLEHKNISHLKTNTFYIAPHELTFHEYDLFCTATMSRIPNDNGWGRGTRPVIDITWYDAIEYCNWRSARDGLNPVYTVTKFDHNAGDSLKKKVVINSNADGYRLPYESEWEYVASNAYKNKIYSWGDLPPTDFESGNVADNSIMSRFPKWDLFPNYKDGFVFTAPVGSFNPNELQLYDLSGNVWEWCYQVPDKLTMFNKKGDRLEEDMQIVRGGSWSSSPNDCLLSKRQVFKAHTQNYTIGFRIAKSF